MDRQIVVVRCGWAHLRILGVVLGVSTLGGWVNAASSETHPRVPLLQDLVDVVWERTLGDPNFDSAEEVALDSGYNVLMAGYVTAGTGYGTTAWLAKIDPIGERVLWRQEMEAGLVGTISAKKSDDRFAGVCVDSSDNVIATGVIGGFTFRDSIVTRKYSPSGSQLWSRTWTNSLSRQYGTAVCVDAAGNIYVAGTAYTSATGIQYQWVILKYSPDGTLQAGFPITYNNLGDETIPDIPYDIGVDTSGNIIVAGQIGVGTGNIDWHVRKYSPTGSLIWSDTFAGPSNKDDVAYRLLVGDGGTVYVAGYTNAGTSNHDWLVIAYAKDPLSGTTANRLWPAPYTYESAPGAWERCTGIAKGKRTILGKWDSIVLVGDFYNTDVGRNMIRLATINPDDGSPVASQVLSAFNNRARTSIATRGNFIALSGTDNQSPSGEYYDMLVMEAKYNNSPVQEMQDDAFGADPLQPPGSQTGWSNFGFNSALGWSDYSATDGALRAHIAASPDYWRISGVRTNPAEYLPYAAVGRVNYVRAKYYVHCGGGPVGPTLPWIPNMRMRLQCRFAVNAMLEVFNHINNDPESTGFGYELRPSSDPANPSLYRVDFDPVDVPYLLTNLETEGIQRGFEAFSTDPQDCGYLGLAESVIGVYPASAIADTGTPAKVYHGEPESLVGDLWSIEHYAYLYWPGSGEGVFGSMQSAAETQVEKQNQPIGMKMRTMNIQDGAVGIATAEFIAIEDYERVNRLRVEENKLYKLRFHLTSSQSTNRQAQIRMRARSIKFCWSQKLEIGGAWATDAAKTYPLNENNSIAQQVLPGIGCMNLDVAGSEIPGVQDGGWYTMLMHSPMKTDIRPDFPAATALALRMPVITSQAGPGVNADSRRDVRVGLDIIDSISGGLGKPLESGDVTIDAIVIRAYTPLSD